MSQFSSMELDSYRLAQYAVQVPCFVCQSGNNFDAEHCRNCFAPMALVYQAGAKKQRPKLVAALGLSGAGKTVYLGMLVDMLSRQNEGLQILARGAFSISLQQNTVGALRQCRFPARTSPEPDNWHWLHCEIKTPQRRGATELIIPDMSGKALSDEFERKRGYPLIQNYLAKCDAVMILLDTDDLQHGDQRQDYFGMQVISYLCEFDNHPKRGWPSRPVSLIFTKADQCSDCWTDPAGYAQKHTPGLWKQCSERLRRHRFFASRVAGACAYRTDYGREHVPLRIEPHGIVEPFHWLVEELATR